MVERMNETTQMIIKVEVGSGDNTTYQKRTFQPINSELTDAKLYNYASIIGGWQTHSINDIMRIDSMSLNLDE